MYQTREINRLDELRALRPVWQSLWHDTPGATFFHSFDWLETYWRFFGRTQKLRVLVVESAGQPVGVLPLTVCIEPGTIGKLRVLTYPLAGWGSFYSPIGPDAATTLEQGLLRIRQTPRDWDVLDLRWIDAPRTTQHAAAHAMRGAGFDCDVRLWHESAQVELDGGWQAYWQSRKSRWRNNVRRSRRKLAQRGTIQHVRYRPRGQQHGEADPRWDLYDACVDIARRSWQGSSRSGTTLSHDAVRGYLRAMHEAAAREGAVDLNLLLVDRQPAAFAYNYHHAGRVYGLRTGFDQAAAHEGAGTVLMQMMLEDSCRRGDRLHDLGPEYLECKRYWLTRLRPAYQFTHYRSNCLRAQMLRAKRMMSRWLSWAGRPGAGLPKCGEPAHA